ncbi:MAG TPA: hypothetical protein VD699_04750 [Nitrosopumilaceae archaeon]|nr:hypothetical protein [Nitrosopumilaceae archaeon]
MNMYDKKTIRCTVCDVFIGEIDFDAQVVLPKCGRCANPMPEIVEKLPPMTGRIEGKVSVMLAH